MNLTYSKPVVLTLIGLLLLPISLAGANSYNQDNTVKNVSNAKSQVISKARDVNTVPVSVPGYKVSKGSHKTDTVEVYYPQLDMTSVLTSVLVNYQLIQAPGKYMANIAPSAKLKMGYTVTRQDANLISVVFRGEQVQENSTQPLLTTVNYNVKASVPITVKRLIQDTDEARQGVSRLLQLAAKANSVAAQPPAFSDQLGYYLTGKYVVFYYQSSDPSEKFVELPVTIDSIRPYLSNDYRTLAVTNELKDPHQIITAIDKSLANYQSVSGKRSEGDVSADFTAYFDNAQLVYVEENQNKGEYESGIAKYYFDDGKLIAYTKNGKSLIVPSGGVASVQREEISLFYDSALNLSDGELKIDGATSELPETYIKAAYTAAEKIQSLSAELLATIKK